MKNTEIFIRIKPFLVRIINLFIVTKKNLLHVIYYFKSIYLRVSFASHLDKYIKNNEIRKLQIGSGDNDLIGWLNTDLYPRKGFAYLDASKPIPIDDATFDRVYSEHMIEHVSFQESYAFLKECFRILRPGSKIRIATPDLEKYIGLFNTDNNPLNDKYIEWISSNWLEKGGIPFKNPSFIINLVMHAWGHLFIFDFDTFRTVLEEIGYKNVTRHNYNESEDIHFHNIERHGEVIGNREMCAFETLIIEAEK